MSDEIDVDKLPKVDGYTEPDGIEVRVRMPAPHRIEGPWFLGKADYHGEGNWCEKEYAKLMAIAPRIYREHQHLTDVCVKQAELMRQLVLTYLERHGGSWAKVLDTRDRERAVEKNPDTWFDLYEYVWDNLLTDEEREKYK